MDYFAYMSRNKIDMLYDQLPEGLIDEFSIANEKETKVDAEGSACASFTKWLPSITAKGAYARKGSIVFNRKIKETYAHKLDICLLSLKKSKLVLDAATCEYSKFKKANYVFYVGNFKVESFDVNSYALLSSTLSFGELSYKLILTCSMIYFSDAKDSEYFIHSGNYQFFEGNVSSNFKCIFIISGIDEETKTIHGSPLFLAIDNSIQMVL